MKVSTIVISLILSCSHCQTIATSDLDIDGVVQGLKVALTGFKDVLQEKGDALTKLAIQAMRMGLQHEDRIRSEGVSGIVQVRNLKEGTKSYHANSLAKDSMASFHDHGSSRRLLGMGEAVYVMNGVEFRTRHSDYAMARPSTTSSAFLDTEAIDLPPVPPSVNQLASVKAQEQEMREYFRAFQAQDASIREYRPYFRPVFCYLEAAWMTSHGDDQRLVDWFTTGKAGLVGFSWEELHDRYRAEATIGGKSVRERTANLPTTIATIDDVTGLPVYAQWNYRPLCFPVDEDIPTSYFKEVDHLSFRHPLGLAENETYYRRGAHFVLDEKPKDGNRKKTLLHKIISSIPGMDNVPSTLTFPALDNNPEKDIDTGDVINLGYYNHWYDIGFHNGYSDLPRGFNDPNLFVSLNSQSQISPLTFTYCSKRTSCSKESARVSYLLPLEIVYLTPLLSWNPYDFEDFKDNDKAAWEGGKSGSTSSKAYNGVSDNFLYQTPISFFAESSADIDPADTRKLNAWVKDKQGTPNQVTASGLRTILPKMESVGQVRLRFPIVPVHGMGSAVWRELEAFKDSWKLSKKD